MTPATARALLALVAAPAELREAVTGDLEEEHRLIAERRGEVAANRWLGRQVLASLPRLALLTVAIATRGAWLRRYGRRPPRSRRPPSSHEDAA